jgi:hypothetical protein
MPLSIQGPFLTERGITHIVDCQLPIADLKSLMTRKPIGSRQSKIGNVT